MTTLAGNKIKNTYKRVLQVPDANTGLTASFQYLQDGDGTNSPIQLSTTAVSIDALTVTSTLNTAAINVIGTLTVTGNIAVSGTVDGRDVATDGAKLDLIEAAADVTDNTNVLAALVGSEASIANQADALPTSAITSGTLADARVAESNVTQHEAALTVTESQVSDLGTYAEAATTMTFTNKTFDANGTGNSISNIDVADLADGTDGELITWSAAGAPTTVAAGTDGQILTSNGAGAAPTFQDLDGVTAGNRVLLDTQTASTSSSIDFDNVFDSTYDKYELDIIALVSGTDNVNILTRVGTGSTPTYQTGSVYDNSSETSMELTFANLGNAAGECFNSEVVIWSPSNTSTYTLVSWSSQFHSTTGATTGALTRSDYSATTAVTSIKIYANVGNITSGTFNLYGIKK